MSKNCGVELKPVVKWAGGKTQLLGELVKDMPENFTKYCEPFVGGGAMLCYVLSHYDVEEICICDANAQLRNLYQVIIDDAKELVNQLHLLELQYNNEFIDNKKFYYDIRSIFNQCDDLDVSQAARFVFLNKICFNGLYRVNKKGQFNVPWGQKKRVNFDSKNILELSKALNAVNCVIKDDYHASQDFIDEDTFVYFDPPYRPLSKTSFISYTENDFDDDCQMELADFVKSLGAKIILSNSDPKNTNPNDNFFDDLYAGFNIRRVDARRNINSNGSGRNPVKELIISNF